MAKGITLIPKRKFDWLPSTDAFIQHIDQFLGAPDVLRVIKANDDRPVLTLEQSGSGSLLNVTEVDQTDPAGRYRLNLAADVFSLDKATTVDWAASQAFLTVNTPNKRVVLESPDDGDNDWYAELGAGGTTGENTYIDVGSSSAARPGFRIATGNGSGSDIERLSINTGVATSTAAWVDTQHSGFVAKDMNFVWQSELTISGGVVTVTGIFHHIDTQNNADSDELDTISGGSAYDLLFIRARHTDRTVVVKHGTGNIYLPGGYDITLDNTEKILMLFRDGSNWFNTSGWWIDSHEAAADPHTGYVLESLFNTHSVIYSISDNLPAQLTVGEQTLVGRLTGANITAVTIGIADNNILQVDHASPADDDYAKFTAAGLEGRSYQELVNDISGVIKATDVEVSELSAATYDDVQNYINFYGHRTVITGGAITDNGDGTVAIASLTGWCPISDSETAVGNFFDYVGGNTPSLTDMTTNYIYLDYNGGTPQLVVSTSILTHGFKLDHIHVGTAFRDGTETHFHKPTNFELDLGAKVDMHHQEETFVHRVAGLITVETGTRNLSITAGVSYEGLNRHTSLPFDTSRSGTADFDQVNKLHDADGDFSENDVGKSVHNTTDNTYGTITAFVDSGELTLAGDTFPDGNEAYTIDFWTYHYYDGDLGTPAWVEVHGATQISNSQYNDVDTGLANFTANRYGVSWVFMEIDGLHFHVVYGQGDYKVNEAEEAGVPSSLPNIVTNYCALIAKIILRQGQTTMIITYPWTTVFTSSLATDHSSLGNLGNDDHTQYILHSLADAANDFLVASGNDTFVKQTLAQTLTTLGKAAASGLASLNASTKVVEQPASITDHLEVDPTEDLATKAPTSEWAFDFEVAYAAHTHILAAGATDVTATAAELNLLDGGAWTAGEVLRATGANAAGFGSDLVKLSAPDISGIVTAASTLTLPAFTLGGTVTANNQGISGASYLSQAGTPATGGFIRLANNQVIQWRNQGNTSNRSLYLDSTDIFVFNAPLYVTGALELTGGLTVGGDIVMGGSAVTGHAQGIADNSILTVDHITPVATDYARFTANGLEGREKSEVLGDLNVADGADVTGSNPPQAHTHNVDGYSGLLADDQHVLDAEVTAVAVARSIFNAQSLLIAVSDNTPVVLEVAALRMIGRAAAGNIVALDKAGVLGIINVEDGATVDQTGAEMVTLLEALAAGNRLDHGAGLTGLGGDDHTQYILHSLADAANDFLVASGANTYIKKTLAETLALISPLSTRGDIMFRNASVNTRLAKGNSGDVLTMGANDPAWSAPAGGGPTIATGTYTGDGTTDRQITTGFKCSLVNIFDITGAEELILIIPNSAIYVTAEANDGTTNLALHATDGFRVGITNQAFGNNNGDTHYYWAISE